MFRLEPDGVMEESSRDPVERRPGRRTSSELAERFVAVALDRSSAKARPRGEE